MTVNKIQLTIPRNTDRIINIPVQLDWELLDTENEINALQSEINAEVAGRPIDFETNRFSHSGVTDVNNVNLDNYDTGLNYEFYFFSGGTISGSGSTQNWILDYRADGFNTDEVYYFGERFKNSFWKLDFYNSPSDKEQTIYLTVIIPTTQGERMPANMQGQDVTIKMPKYILNWIGDKEGFFIYWLKKRDFLNIDTFYMTAKFFNAKTGQFTKMMTGRGTSQIDLTNGPQVYLSENYKYTFDNTQYFYYTVKLNYETQTYQVLNTTGQRLGTNIPIKWYEYVNPPQ